MTLALIAIGAFFGGIGRFSFSKLLPTPAGTYVANCLACIVLALTMAVPDYIFLSAGFAGALSTWSTLAKELGTFIQRKRPLFALGYFLLTVTSGIFCIALLHA
ncbi:CrcB family protein [Corynebacterium sp. HS2168-gen11]|uniref:CrcB family protein n=1 Tax=Corynebacterium sp. HS2168-gen11 TaxID=2974027 RepID=UPI00216B11EA|nr:CrcB family protein [Corynebacterium sp. HS2168-gen11]MCS4535257.1 CrcB family protein [Corynebacterium sp. HS2168-gen11]